MDQNQPFEQVINILNYIIYPVVGIVAGSILHLYRMVYHKMIPRISKIEEINTLESLKVHKMEQGMTVCITELKKSTDKSNDSYNQLREVVQETQITFNELMLRQYTDLTKRQIDIETLLSSKINSLELKQAVSDEKTQSKLSNIDEKLKNLNEILYSAIPEINRRQKNKSEE